MTATSGKKARIVLIGLIGFAVLGNSQAQNPPAEPIQQGTVADPTGYDPPSDPIVASPVAPGGMIDLSDPNSPPPLIAAGIPADRRPGDPHFGDQVARSRLVQEYKPEKILVFPDDPDSAWWETNVRFAFARCQREMKPLLLLFTAVWVPRAMDLSAEVFATKSFNSYVKENLVICYLAYPQNIKDAPRSMQWAKKEFKVAGYPNVLVFNPHGEVERALRGYSKGKPVDYFNNLKSACGPVLAAIDEEKKSLSKRGYREWRNPQGRVLFAKFVKRDDLLVTLRDGRGQEWTIAIDHLCEEDQIMARSFPRIDQLQKEVK